MTLLDVGQRPPCLYAEPRFGLMKNITANRWLTPLILVLFTSALAGCVQVTVPVLPKVAPAQWTHAPAPEAGAIKPDLSSWWTAFSDPQLNTLVKLTIAQNLTIAQAQDRIHRARIQLGHAGDEFLPELRAHAQPNESISARDTYFQYGLDATWELSLFGREESVLQIAQAAMNSSEAEASAAQVSVVAEVVRSYIELRTSQQQKQLLERQSQLSQARQRLLSVRQRLGLGAAKELAAVNSEALLIQINLTKSQQLADSAAQRLALLLGQTSANAEWLVAAPQPQLGSYGFEQLPADMLRTRPEIKLAEAAVLQATGELGVARADIYPYLSLGSAYLYSFNLTGNVAPDGVSHSTPAIGPTIDIPLFDWGRRRANMKVQQAALDTSLLAYRESILEAVAEIETALSSLQSQKQILTITQANKSSRERELVRIQHLQQLGFSSELDSISEQQQTVESELALLEAHASHNLAFVALYKSLGGAPLPADGAQR
jgi:outer membrane protein, multidrug efflux system